MDAQRESHEWPDSRPYPRVLSQNGSWSTIEVSEGDVRRYNGKRALAAVLAGREPRKKNSPISRTVSLSVMPETRKRCHRVRNFASVVEGKRMTIDDTLNMALEWFEKVLKKHYAQTMQLSMSEKIREKLELKERRRR